MGIIFYDMTLVLCPVLNSGICTQFIHVVTSCKEASFYAWLFDCAYNDKKHPFYIKLNQSILTSGSPDADFLKTFWISIKYLFKNT